MNFFFLCKKYPIKIFYCLTKADLYMKLFYT